MPHLLVFSHLRWNFVYERPQHLLSRLARLHEVLFIEEPVHTDGPARIDSCEVAPGVTLLTPRTAVAAAGFHDDQLPVLRSLIADFLRARRIDDYLAWFYTPMALPLLAELTPRAVVYDCMQEPGAFKDAPAQLRQRESALLRAARLVLAGGPSLFEAKRHQHPNVLCIPSAVDASHYAPRSAAGKLDLMLRAEQIQGRIPGPRLGFFGVIDECIDMGLIDAVASAEPDWQLIMVGPVANIDAAQRPQRPNIHWLGAQPHALLPQLVADWDVCLLPFAINESTRCISPTQTLEYMAAEKPIVSTALRDVVAMYGDVVRIGHDVGGFIEGCRWALSETGFKRAERINDMLATVSRYSWDNAARCVHEAIELALRGTWRPQAEPEEEQPVAAVLRTVGDLALAEDAGAPARISARFIPNEDMRRQA